jgi:hypothetical protein
MFHFPSKSQSQSQANLLTIRTPSIHHPQRLWSIFLTLTNLVGIIKLILDKFIILYQTLLHHCQLMIPHSVFHMEYHAKMIHHH